MALKSLSEAAAILAVSIQTVHNLKNAGLLAVVRCGVKKGFRVDEEEIARYLRERREHPGKDAPRFPDHCKPIKLKHLK